MRENREKEKRSIQFLKKLKHGKVQTCKHTNINIFPLVAIMQIKISNPNQKHSEVLMEQNSESRIQRNQRI